MPADFPAEIKVRVSVAMKAELAALAKEERPGTKISDIARDAIGEFLARQKKKPSKSSR